MNSSTMFQSSMCRTLGIAIAIASISACVDRGSDAADSSAATRLAQADSASGEVAQYALMKNAIGWLTDSNLVSLAGTINQAPANLARLETQVWENERIHGFALEIIRDHAALQQAIDSLATRRRIPGQRPAVADIMQAGYDSVTTPLSMLPVQVRESKLLDAIVAIHGRTANDFAAVAGNASDPDLRALFATRALLMEQGHIAKAQVIAASIAKADSAKQAATPRRKP